MKSILLASLALVLSACSAPQPSERLVSFDEAEYAPFAQPGTATVEGQAFSPTSGGGVVKAAGRNVVLTPKKRYTDESFERVVLKDERITPGDPRGQALIRQTTADAEGNFRFEGVPAGEYYLTCVLRWSIHDGRYSSRQEGGWLAKRIKVGTGERLRVMLSEAGR